MAERRLENYCSSYTDAGGGSAASASGSMDAPRGRPAGRGRCWHVYRSLHQARLHAEAAAGSELAASGGHAGPRVHDVEVLEQLVRELWFVGPADALRVLATNQAMLDRLAADQPLEAAAGAPAPATAAAAGAGLTVVNGLARSTAEEIFRRLDRTGSGFIDRGDLMAGLGLLGE